MLLFPPPADTTQFLFKCIKTRTLFQSSLQGSGLSWDIYPNYFVAVTLDTVASAAAPGSANTTPVGTAEGYLQLRM